MKLNCCSNKTSINEISKTAEFLKVISVINRLKIICLLREQNMCVCDIWQYLGLSQNLTSQHLKTLKNFGLVSSKKVGLKVTYSLNKDVVENYIKTFNKFLNSYEK